MRRFRLVLLAILVAPETAHATEPDYDVPKVVRCCSREREIAIDVAVRNYGKTAIDAPAFAEAVALDVTDDAGTRVRCDPPRAPNRPPRTLQPTDGVVERIVLTPRCDVPMPTTTAERHYRIRLRHAAAPSLDHMVDVYVRLLPHS